MAKKKRRVIIGDSEYNVRARVYESFGEDAFRLQLDAASTWALVNKHCCRTRNGPETSATPGVDWELGKYIARGLVPHSQQDPLARNFVKRRDQVESC